MKIANAFSLNMVVAPATIKVENLSLAQVKELGELESVVGHAETAAILSSLLGTEVKMNRATVALGKESIVVAQYKGPRLPEGTTILPEGAKIEFLMVTVQ